MTLRCTSDTDILTVYMTDAKVLDALIIEQIHQELVGILERTEQRNVVLNFGAVKFMSSAALGMLIRVNKKCKEFKVNLKLSNIQPDIAQVFKITGLDKVFRIYKTAEDAYAAFQKEGLFFRG
jgi:anti-anti-sigma factor